MPITTDQDNEVVLNTHKIINEKEYNMTSKKQSSEKTENIKDKKEKKKRKKELQDQVDKHIHKKRKTNKNYIKEHNNKNRKSFKDKVYNNRVSTSSESSDDESIIKTKEMENLLSFMNNINGVGNIPPIIYPFSTPTFPLYNYSQASSSTSLPIFNYNHPVAMVTPILPTQLYYPLYPPTLLNNELTNTSKLLKEKPRKNKTHKIKNKKQKDDTNTKNPPEFSNIEKATEDTVEIVHHEMMGPDLNNIKEKKGKKHKSKKRHHKKHIHNHLVSPEIPNKVKLLNSSVNPYIHPLMNHNLITSNYDYQNTYPLTIPTLNYSVINPEKEKRKKK